MGRRLTGTSGACRCCISCLRSSWRCCMCRAAGLLAFERRVGTRCCGISELVLVNHLGRGSCLFQQEITTDFTETATELTRRIFCERPWLFREIRGCFSRGGESGERRAAALLGKL